LVVFLTAEGAEDAEVLVVFLTAEGAEYAGDLYVFVVFFIL
jgi:hypothetical protein